MREQDRDMFINPEMNYIRTIDDEIKRVLYEPNVHPDIKYKKYMDLFNKYNAAMKNVTKPFEIEIKSKNTPIPQQQQQQQIPQEQPMFALQEQPQQAPQFQQEIAMSPQPNPFQTPPPTAENHHQHAPHGQAHFSGTRSQTPNVDLIARAIKKFKVPEREKANRVMEVLNKDSRISWDDSGQIYYKSKPIPGSNIENTLNDLMKVRKNTKPGFTEVVMALKDHKFPTKYIVNSEIFKKLNNKTARATMSQYDETSGDEYFSGTDGSEQGDDESDIDPDSTLQLGNGFAVKYKQVDW
jgi:hypothetical protein